MIYFDNSATTFYKPEEVKRAVKYAIDNYTANAGRSTHDYAQKTALQVFETREVIKEFLNAKNYDVIFTKNCSEALNLAILGNVRQGGHVITTTLEHNSVLRPLKHLEKEGKIELTIVDPRGSAVSAHEIFKAFKQNTYMVIINHISNVTGALCDINEIGNLKKIKEFIYIVDGAQSFGHVDIDLEKAGVDYFAISGHKGGMSLTGVGAMLARDISNLTPIMFGGTGTDSLNLIQPNRFAEDFEVGTLPIIPIISLKAGVEYLVHNFDYIKEQERKLDEKMIKLMNSLDGITKYFDDRNVNGVFSFNVLNLSSEVVADFLNENGIAVRSGLQCAPLVHVRLGTEKRGAVRVSINHFNNEEELKKLEICLKSLIKKARCVKVL